MPKSGQPWDPHFLLHHPLFRLWEPFARPFRSTHWPGPDQYTEQLERFCQRTAPHLRPLRFVDAPKRPRRAKRSEIDLGALYDGSIALAGEIFCLGESFHDLLNAIVFCAFPLAKRTLHERQFRAQRAWLESSGALIEGTKLPGRRTREQDALTIFDEGGTLLLMSESSHEEWCRESNRRPLATFDEDHLVPFLFGHALLEHLHEGHPALRSSGAVVVVSDLELLSAQSEGPFALFELADQRLASRLGDLTEFQRPGADAIFELSSDGNIWIGPPKPAWHLPHPDDVLPAGARRPPP